VTNTERVVIETYHTFAEPEALGTTNTLPLRLTLEHTSDIAQGEHFTFHLGLRAQGGLEDRITAGAVNRVPAFGVEGELGVRIRY
jgi:hypothetical protein